MDARTLLSTGRQTGGRTPAALRTVAALMAAAAWLTGLGAVPAQAAAERTLRIAIAKDSLVAAAGSVATGAQTSGGHSPLAIVLVAGLAALLVAWFLRRRRAARTNG